MIIGITGSSGAGKSTICEILQEKYNAKIITADKIAKELSQKGTKYLQKIVEQFGQEILLENGELNRKKLANIIYYNSQKREELNNCTLKYICEEIKKQIDEYINNYKGSNESETKKLIIAIDAPLLFESNLDKICDAVVGVIAKEHNKIERNYLFRFPKTK